MKKERIIARITEQEKEKITVFCNKNNINISKFIREIISKRNLETINIVTNNEKEVLDNLAYEIQKVGININQIAYFFNLEHLKNLDKNSKELNDILLLDTLKKEQLENIKNIVNIVLEKIEEVNIKLNGYGKKI